MVISCQYEPVQYEPVRLSDVIVIVIEIVSVTSRMTSKKRGNTIEMNGNSFARLGPRQVRVHSYCLSGVFCSHRLRL